MELRIFMLSMKKINRGATGSCMAMGVPQRVRRIVLAAAVKQTCCQMICLVMQRKMCQETGSVIIKRKLLNGTSVNNMQYVNSIGQIGLDWVNPSFTVKANC